MLVRDVTWGALVEGDWMKYIAQTGLWGVLSDTGQIWVDATEMVDFNLDHSLKIRPELLFRLDALPGCVYPELQEFPAPGNLDLLTQLLDLGAHLTHYLREQILERFHHPTHAGISTSKVAGELVGNLHKLANQTLLSRAPTLPSSASAARPPRSSALRSMRTSTPAPQRQNQ